MGEDLYVFQLRCVELWELKVYASIFMLSINCDVSVLERYINLIKTIIIIIIIIIILLLFYII